MRNHIDNLLTRILLLVLLSSLLPGPASWAQELVLRGGVPIYVHPQEPAAVRRAVVDLQRDLATVLGKPSQVVTTLPRTGPVLVVATGRRYAGSQPAATGWEAHQLYADRGRVVLNGADPRGTIYAIYSFSELVLGVQPLWFWASEPPQPQASVRVPAGFRRVFGSPYVKYRAWFPNDRDLITPWQARSEENYEAFYETMLRLKLNTLEGGTTDEQSFSTPYRLGREVAVAQARGLLSTGHHMLVFGSSYQYWDAYWQQVRHLPVPALTIANRQALREWWGYHIDLAQRNHLDMIWLVGFRGNRDIPFWEFFPDAPADEASRAKVIEEMVQLQIALLKEKTKDPHPFMRLTLYNEMSTLVAKNLFHIPNEPSLIRNFVAARRDHFPAPDIRTYHFTGEPVGYYMNLQFTSSGSHLAQAEGPWKMEQNFRMVDSLSGHHLLFSVMNAGNIREHVLGLAANADMMWNFRAFDADAFLRRFSTTYYGARFGPEIATLYCDFFNAYWQQKKGDIPGFKRQYLFQDMRYGRAAEMLLTDLEAGKYRPNALDGNKLDDPSKGSVGYFRVVPADNGTTNQLEAMLKGTATSIARLEAVTAKADQLYPQLTTGQRFFDDNLRGQAYLMLHLNRMLYDLTRAYQATNDRPQQQQLLQQSLAELRLAQQRLQQSDQGKFAGWYANERLFGLKKIAQRLNDLQEKRGQ